SRSSWASSCRQRRRRGTRVPRRPSPNCRPRPSPPDTRVFPERFSRHRQCPDHRPQAKWFFFRTWLVTPRHDVRRESRSDERKVSLPFPRLSSIKKRQAQEKRARHEILAETPRYSEKAG